MVNTNKLCEYIAASGLKKSYIAKILGVSMRSLSSKTNTITEFKASEIDALCVLLRIEDLREKEAIFFASK